MMKATNSEILKRAIGLLAEPRMAGLALLILLLVLLPVMQQLIAALSQTLMLDFAYPRRIPFIKIGRSYGK
jgi:hypothetical protein